MLLGALSLSGCGSRTEDSPGGAAVAADKGPSATASWADVVSTRIRNADHAFIPDGDGFRAEVPERGLLGHFDADGASLSQSNGASTSGDEEFIVRTVGWGRPDSMQEVAPTLPELGDCVAGVDDPEGKCVRRLESEADGLTEWWTATEAGFEQGWSIDSPPNDDGLLAVDVEVVGATASVGDGEIWLSSASHDDWIVSGVAAWGADGTPLSATLAQYAGGFRVLVDDAGGRYPITIDPVYTTATTTLSGASLDRFGYAVSGAGDVNGDGYDDVIVGAYGYNSYQGRAYLYHGSSGGVSTTASSTLTGAASFINFGYSVSGAGDVNRDGYDDVIVGAYAEYSSQTGRAYVFHGSATGVSSAASTTLTGGAAFNYFGYSVSGAGDVNGDGYDDVIVGAYGYSSSTGRAYAFHGSATGLSATASTTLTGSGSNSQFGFAVSDAGDVNGDGFDDVIVGAKGYSYDAGRAYVFHGSTGGILTTAATTVTGGANYNLGCSVASAGDVNGDGYDDVIVGASGYNYNAGRAYVFHGSATTVSASPSTTLSGTATSNFGYSVSGAGDVNRDGYDDVIVGADEYSSYTGRAYVFEGSASAVSASASTTLTGAATTNYFGCAVAGAGDVNADGYGDVVVGAWAYGASTGRAYVYLGYSDADGDGYVGALDCNDADATVHPSAAETVADGIDQDCDGVDSCYTDADGDNYGTTVVVDGSSLSCSTGTGAPVSTDCNDGSATVNPGAAETVADGVDQDCDGVDSCYTDADGDNYGTAVVVDGSSLSCSTGTGAPVATDCNDASATVNPAATETVADGIDQNCNGVDSCYTDADNDNYGTAVVTDGSSLSCSTGTGAPVATDCNDLLATVNPGAAETVADSVDQDCDGVDSCYTDADNDNYGTTVVTDGSSLNCSTGTGAPVSTDCNDAVAAINPGATEVCDAANTDEDCDGLADNADSSAAASGKTTFYPDADADGYGSTSGALYCDQPASYVSSGTDCNDGAASIHPAAAEVVADGIDQDCDSVDSCYTDTDNDNYGTTVVTDGSSLNCSTGTGAPVSTDCDDASAAINPAAPETVADGIDQDCDSVDSCYTDADDDNYGTAVVIDGSSLNCTTGTGAPVATDCNDAVAAINPGATEICDPSNTDEDCDGFADDGDSSVASTGKTTYYADADSDGYGATVGALYCDAPSATVTDNTDCNDANASIHPSAPETVADGIDQDCDAVDSCYTDADNDNYGTAIVVDGSSLNCTTGTGAPVATDCDDSSAAINPGATEVCDAANTDEDCDGLADDADSSVASSGKTTYYADADSDGYGATFGTEYCDAPSGVVSDHADCDDTSASVHPSAPEAVADGIDQDCDSVDSCYADSDGDNYGTSVVVDGSSLNCTTGTGAPVATDCDDSSAAINPAATEICDAASTDEDCDGLADDADSSVASSGKTTYYADSDSDGYGSAIGAALCHAPSGSVTDNTDCNDTNSAINPGTTEVCDPANVDEDCDGLADDADPGVASSGMTTFYADSDGDGYGSASGANSCDAPSGTVTDNTDCDDTVGSVHPGAAEVCDAANTDEDCNGLADDADPGVDTSGTTTFYADLDGDGYGSSVGSDACDAPSGAVTDNTDCDDASPAVNPGSTEVAGDGTDGDCDGTELCYVDADADGYRPDASSTLLSGDTDCADRGEAWAIAPTGDCNDSIASINPSATEVAGDGIDEDCDTAESCYVDADLDGARSLFLVASPDAACNAPGEALASADLDCDDADPNVDPAATEVPGSGVDENCDGVELCYVDADGDGYRPDGTSTVASADGDCNDPGEALASALTGDCDDTSTAYNPAASETDCTDPNDYNCDGSTGYDDVDGDGFAACDECDDGDAAVYPGATEIPGDGIDGDCDGVDTCFVDADGDGYRPDSTSVVDGTTIACNGAGEASDLEPVNDCDDGDPTVNPGAIETVGDGLDADCDGLEVCYVDADADGYRSEDGAVIDSIDADCADAGEALASAGIDCDDASASVSPDAAEIPGDGIDEDCDNAEVCYVDTDADGFRPNDGSTVATSDLGCTDPGDALATAPSTDCDDADAAVNPDATEIVGDAIDQDCDGAEVCYADVDGDGYRGDDGATVASADADCADFGEALATTLTGDCNDADPAYNPAAVESDCFDPNDYNCDGSTGYNDADADGFAACEECSDGDASIFPGAAEVAGDGVDQDCDGMETCFVDADDDGYRPDATSTVASANIACDGAGEALSTDGIDDCDDLDPAVNPHAIEIAGDEIDQDCDGTEYCFVDADGDGYTSDGGAVVLSADLLCDGTGEALATALSGDCDDGDSAYHPGATESNCTDPADYNCDGSSGFADADGDGFAACEECDDASSGVNPDATEVCNGLDDDCDGTIDQGAADATLWYADADGDGFTDPAVFVTACDAPDGYAAATTDDCDDTDATVFPGAAEIVGDGIDQDCDGSDAADTGDSGDDSGSPDDTGSISDTGTVKGKECGCATSDGGGAAGTLLLGLLAVVARRRAWPFNNAAPDRR